MSTLLIISLFIQFIISIQISSFSVCRVHRDTEATRSENPARCSLQAGALQPHTAAWRAPAPWTLLSLCTAQGSVKFPVSSNISSSVTFVRAFGIVTSDIPILFQGNNWLSTMDNILQGRGHKWLLLTHFPFPYLYSCNNYSSETRIFKYTQQTSVWKQLQCNFKRAWGIASTPTYPLLYSPSTPLKGHGSCDFLKKKAKFISPFYTSSPFGIYIDSEDNYLFAGNFNTRESAPIWGALNPFLETVIKVSKCTGLRSCISSSLLSSTTEKHPNLQVEHNSWSLEKNKE